MHRLYIDLAVACKMYVDNNERFQHGSIAVNSRERRDGKVWVDLESGEINTKYISDSEEVISQIMEIAEYLTPEEIPADNTENTENAESAEKIAETIRTSDTWDMEALAELCELAGMSEEWESADGETFEAVAYAAAKKMGVEIV